MPIRERGRFTQAGFTPEDIQKFGQSFENVWSPERQPIPVNQGYKFSLGNSNTVFGKEFGYLGVISYGNSHSYGTQVRNAYRLGLNEVLSPVTSYNIERSGNEVEWGTVLNTSLRFSPQHRISLRSLFTHTAEDETRTWEGFNADRNTDMRSTRLRYVERQLFSGQLAGTHDFDFREPVLEDPKQPDVSMEWRLTYSRAARDEPDTRENIYEDRGDGTYTFRDVTQSGSRFFFDLEDNEYKRPR